MVTENDKQEVFTRNDPAIIKEYLERMTALEYSMQSIKEDKKFVKEQYENKIDVKIIKKIEKLIKLRSELREEMADDGLVDTVEGIMGKISTEL